MGEALAGQDGKAHSLLSRLVEHHHTGSSQLSPDTQRRTSPWYRGLGVRKGQPWLTTIQRKRASHLDPDLSNIPVKGIWDPRVRSHPFCFAVFNEGVPGWDI